MSPRKVRAKPKETIEDAAAHVLRWVDQEVDGGRDPNDVGVAFVHELLRQANKLDPRVEALLSSVRVRLGVSVLAHFLPPEDEKNDHGVVAPSRTDGAPET